MNIRRTPGTPTRVCSCCHEEKPREKFPPHKNTRDGLHSWCHNCLRLAANARNAAIREALSEYFASGRL